MSNNKYLREIDAFKVPGTNQVDIYSILSAFDVESHAIGHAIKKLLCAGIRGKGDELQDLTEAVQAIERRIDEIKKQGEVIEELTGEAKDVTKEVDEAIKRDLRTTFLSQENSTLIDSVKSSDPSQSNDETKRIVVKKNLNAIDSYSFVSVEASGHKKYDLICQTSEDGAVNEFIIMHPHLSNIIWYSRSWGEFSLVSTSEGYNAWVQECSTKCVYLYSCYRNMTREKAKQMFEKDWADRQENLK